MVLPVNLEKKKNGNVFLFFPQLASSSLLRLGQETDKEATKNRESIYLLLDEVGGRP